MAEFYRFFDSTIDDIREYTADEFSEYFRMVLTNGIYNGGTNLQVVAGGGDMTVDIEDGYANIYGYLYKVLGGVTLPIETADVTYNRIDRIVLRWDKREESRFIKAMVLKGVAAEHPTPPELTRTDDIHELSLAQVLVKAGTNNISGDAVTDERLNTEVCGLINSLIQADTTEIFNQFQAWYNEKIPNFEKAFSDWYTSKIPAYEKQWSDWYETHPPVYEKQWSDWYSAQTKEGFVLTEEKGVPHGVATLDENGKLNVEQFDYTVLSAHTSELHKLRKQNTTQDKELAYLKLKQDAADRIEGGTTFADDIQGNSFGITFNEEASENAVVRNGGLTMNVGAMVENNVDDSVVISGSYSTQGNAGRKLIRLNNGTLFCVVRSSSDLCLYKSTDDGNTWIKIWNPSYTSVQDVCIETDGKYVFGLICKNSSTVTGFSANEKSAFQAPDIIQSQTALDTCSLAINEEGTELHACWASKNSTYPNSFNIQYCKGVIGEGGTVTWGNVEQVTKLNISNKIGGAQPAIVLDDETPLIFIQSHHYKYNNNFGYVNMEENILALKRDISLTIDNTYFAEGWSASVVIANGYSNYSPSAIYVPPSITGTVNGRIWVAWHGYDSTDTTRYNIRVSYSDDNGLTWSSAEKLTSGNTYYQEFPSITANKNNEVYILWGGTQSGTNFMIRQIKWSNGSWGEIENIKQVSGYQSRYPSTLYDATYELQFTKPPMVYTLGNYSSVNFTGSWQVGGYTPTTTSTAVYTLPSTDYVGLFVQKEGSVNITATVNDTPMDAVLDGNEYQFTKALDSEAPVTLKLSLSRENTTNGDNDKVTRILGGIS